MSSINRSSFLSFSLISLLFFSFCSLTVRTSSAMFHKSGESGHHWFVINLRKKVFSLSLLNVMLVLSHNTLSVLGGGSAPWWAPLTMKLGRVECLLALPCSALFSLQAAGWSGGPGPRWTPLTLLQQVLSAKQVSHWQMVKLEGLFSKRFSVCSFNTPFP